MSNSTLSPTISLPVTPVNGQTYFGTGAPTKTATTGSKNLTMANFINLLTTELANQNPLDPMKDTDFFSQIAQLGNVQGFQNLQDSATMQQAQSLLGTTVTAVQPMTSSTNGQSATVTGQVVGIKMQNGNLTLSVQEANGGTVDVGLSSLQNVAPSQSLTNLSSMIGKTVTGTGTITTGGVSSTVSAVGQVIGISQDSGTPMLEVSTTTNGTVAVAPSSVTNIAQ